MKALIWNLRSVRTQNAFQRVQLLHNFHKFNFVALMEPFQHVTYLNRFTRRLRMAKGYANNNGKIWLFVNHGFEVVKVSNSDQQFTVQIKNLATNFTSVVTIVYAKCDPNQILELWEDIAQLASGMDQPSIIGGDFNVVLNGGEKIGVCQCWGLRWKTFKIV